MALCSLPSLLHPFTSFRDPSRIFVCSMSSYPSLISLSRLRTSCKSLKLMLLRLVIAPALDSMRVMSFCTFQGILIAQSVEPNITSSILRCLQEHSAVAIIDRELVGLISSGKKFISLTSMLRLETKHIDA